MSVVQKKRDIKYYIERFTKQENMVHELSLKKQGQLKTIYREARRDLQNNLASFIERYKKENDFTSADLKKMLNTKEQAEFKYTVGGYVREIERLGTTTKEAKALKKELDIMAGRTRVSRKEELITTINYELGKAGIKVKNTIGKHLERVTEFVIKDTNKIMTGNTLIKLDTKMVERIVNQKWDSKNYSDRIWSNRTGLARKVMKNLTISFVQGHDFEKMSDRLTRDMKVGYYESRRIMETETTGALENAKAETFKELGVEKYQFIATVDDRTSDICLSLDGKIFDMKERQIGVNCPFMHPFCRSVTIPVVDDKSIQKKEGKNKDESLKNNTKNREKKIISYDEVLEKAKIIASEIDFSNIADIKEKVYNYSKYIIKRENLNGLPKVVSSEEFEKLSKGKIILYRGIADIKDLKAKDMVKDFKYGEFFTGKGIYGNGTYATPIKELAKKYETKDGKTSGEIIEMLLIDEAKTITFTELYHQLEKSGILQRVSMKSKLENYEEVIGNLGNFGMLKGYDAIMLNGSFGHDHYVILDRSKLIVKE